jgi:hypothetical protein
MAQKKQMTTKKNEVQIHATTRMNPENMLSERSQEARHRTDRGTQG